jgi:hypothetical protein
MSLKTADSLIWRDMQKHPTWNLTEAEWREALKIAIIAMEQDISVEEAARQIH